MSDPAACDHGSGGQLTGHASGRHIVRILQADTDVAHVRTVVGYVHRHLARRPKGGVEDRTWRRSPMRWGHDPL